MGEEVAEYNGAYKASHGIVGMSLAQNVLLTRPISKLGFGRLGMYGGM